MADSRHPREEACDVTVSVPSVSAVEAKESSLAIVDHRDARMFRCSCRKRSTAFAVSARCGTTLPTRRSS